MKKSSKPNSKISVVLRRRNKTERVGSPRSQSWTPQKVLRVIGSLHRQKYDLSPGYVQANNKPLYFACVKYWDSFRIAVEKAGLRYEDLLRGPAKWKRENVLAELRRRHQVGDDLSHNAIKRADASLLAGAKRQFGSYRHAIEAAGISYATVAKELQKSWSRASVIDAIRGMFEKGRALSHNYIKKQEPRLFSAIFRYFKNFRSAIRAAGLDYGKVAEVPQQRWNREKVLKKLQDVVRHRKRLTHRTMGVKLHAAVTRLYGNIPSAAKAAGLCAEDVARVPPKPWNKIRVLSELKSVAQSGRRVIGANLSYGLHRHLLRYFGSIEKAVSAAGLDYGQVAKHPWERWNQKRVIDELRTMSQKGRPITVRSLGPKLYSAVRRYVGTLTDANDVAVGTTSKFRMPTGSSRSRTHWTENNILQRLRELFKDGRDLRHAKMRTQYSSLFWAARERFGTYAAALKKAGLSYESIVTLQLQRENSLTR